MALPTWGAILLWCTGAILCIYYPVARFLSDHHLLPFHTRRLWSAADRPAIKVKSILWIGTGRRKSALQMWCWEWKRNFHLLQKIMNSQTSFIRSVRGQEDLDPIGKKGRQQVKVPVKLQRQRGEVAGTGEVHPCVRSNNAIWVLLRKLQQQGQWKQQRGQPEQVMELDAWLAVLWLFVQMTARNIVPGWECLRPANPFSLAPYLFIPLAFVLLVLTTE